MTKPKDTKRYRCEICSRLFNRGIELANHMKAHKREAAQPPPPKFATAANGELQCPECPHTSPTIASLANHRARSHDVKSANQLRIEKRSTTPESTVEHVSKTPQACPECGKICANIAALANHRQAAHNILSANRAHKIKRAEKLAAKNGLEVVVPTPNNERRPVNDKIPQQQTDSAIDPLLFAFAVGQIKEQCRRIAEEHDVPTKLFTRQFAELFLRQARG